MGSKSCASRWLRVGAGAVLIAVVTLGCHDTMFCSALSFWVVDHVPSAAATKRLSLTSPLSCPSFGRFRRCNTSTGSRRSLKLYKREGYYLLLASRSLSINTDETPQPTAKPADIAAPEASSEASTLLSTSPSPASLPLASDSSQDARLSSPTEENSGTVPAVASRTEYSEIVHCLFTQDDSCTSSSDGVVSCGPIYVFDGVCNFCNDSVQLCYDLDQAKVLRFCSMQSPAGQAILQHFGKAPDDWSSLVLVENADTAHFQSDAVLQLVRHLSGVPPLVRTMAALAQMILPEPLRHAAYHVVADNRHMFGSSDGPTCRVDLDPSRFVDSDYPTTDAIVCPEE